ncbi:MAG: AI-2E family transporter [Ruminococcaceae bacterium]|nr:AI-2E family transporter [Oscillospiraceae bacterium]
MKIEWNRKYTTIAIYSFLVLAATVLFAVGLMRLSDIWNFIKNIISKLSPIILGIAIAYLLNPILNFFERKVFKKVFSGKKASTLRRALSLVCVVLSVLVAIYLIIIIILPQIIESYKTLASSYNSVDDIITSIINYFKTNEFFANNYEQVLSLLGIDMTTGDSAIIEELYNIAKTHIPTIITAIKDVAMGIYGGVIAFILSIYLLAYREKVLAICKKLFASYMSPTKYDKLFHVFSITDHNFGMYIRGRLFDAVIVFLICYIAYGLMGLKYYPLLAFITGITNIIPFFGPFVGAIPVAMIVLFTQPQKILWVLIAILLIQLLDGNFISPLILGDSIGLSSIWIISSVIVFGELFGFIGMLLGVPVFATIYSLIREKTNETLEAKELPTPLSEYYPNAKQEPDPQTKQPLYIFFAALWKKIKSAVEKIINKFKK